MSKPFTPNKTIMLNQEQERLWSNAVGGLILNFGGIELITFTWIEHFEPNHLVSNRVINMTLAERLKRIHDLIAKSDLESVKLARAIQLWKEIADHSQLRNTIAHHPIVFSTGPDGLPAMGFPNFNHMKGPGPHAIPLVQVITIIETAKRVGEIHLRLDELLAGHQPTT